MFKISLVSGNSFVAAEGTNLIEAVTEADLALPYSCKTGRCGTCRMKVVSGITAVIQDEIGLTDAERAGGWIFGCCRAAMSDLEIDVEDPMRMPGRSSGVPMNSMPAASSVELNILEFASVQLGKPLDASILLMVLVLTFESSDNCSTLKRRAKRASLN